MNDHSKNNATKQYNIAYTALNVVLVIIETLLTLLLRFDGNLRRAVYPLATTNTVLCIHSYVPNVTFYATFTINGILLDRQLQPSQQVDVTINGFTWQIAQSLLTNQTAAIKQLQIRGEAQKVEQIKAFLNGIGVNQLLYLITKTLKGDKKADKPKKPYKTLDDYREQITALKEQLNGEKLENTALQTQVSQLQSQNKLLKWVLLVLIILLLVSTVGWGICYF